MVRSWSFRRDQQVVHGASRINETILSPHIPLHGPRSLSLNPKMHIPVDLHFFHGHSSPDQLTSRSVQCQRSDLRRTVDQMDQASIA